MLALLAGCSTVKKAEQPKEKYNYRRAIAPASLAFVSGASWGVNQTLAHHNDRIFRAFPKASREFWGADSWKGRGWNDGHSVTAATSQTLLFGAGICIPLGKKKPLWHYAADIGITSAAYTLGNLTTHNLIFHK